MYNLGWEALKRMDNEKKQKRGILIRTLDILDIVERLVLPIVTIIISVVALRLTNQTSLNVAEYQISQERLPRVISLNQEVPLSFSIIEDGPMHAVVDFSTITGAMYPLQIPIYNVGVGLAQNCKVAWNEDSVENAILELKEYLDEETTLRFDEFSYFSEGGLQWMLYDYNFEIEDGTLESIVYWDAVKQGYIRESVFCETLYFPYILPLSDQTTQLYIPVPTGLVTLLVEVANQGVEFPVSISYGTSYQDLSGKEYIEEYEITFLLIERVQTDNKVDCVYRIMSQKID